MTKQTPIVERKIKTVNGTYLHLNATAEQDVIVFSNFNDLCEVSLDMTSLAQDTIVKIREKVNGSDYKTIQQATYPTDFDGFTGVFNINGKNRDIKITMQSLVLEGINRNIPHSRVEELRTV